MSLDSGDGYVRAVENRWVIGTSLVEKTIALDGGRLALTSFNNKTSGRDYVVGGVPSRELRLTVNGNDIMGAAKAGH